MAQVTHTKPGRGKPWLIAYHLRRSQIQLALQKHSLVSEADAKHVYTQPTARLSCERITKAKT